MDGAIAVYLMRKMILSVEFDEDDGFDEDVVASLLR